jgi:hypothetical protein
MRRRIKVSGRRSLGGLGEGIIVEEVYRKVPKTCLPSIVGSQILVDADKCRDATADPELP